jgi:hypothetical protein
MSTRETICLWWTVVKASFAYQVLVCIGPLMTGQMVPLANAKQANSVRRYRNDSMSHQQLVYTCSHHRHVRQLYLAIHVRFLAGNATWCLCRCG